MKNILILLFACLTLGCSGSNSNTVSNAEDAITGSWFTGCVESASLPFPVGVSLAGYVVVELTFDSGNFNANWELHANSECNDVVDSTQFFEGTYTIGEPTTLVSGEVGKSIHIIGSDLVFFYDLDIMAYYLIEDDVLYMSDLAPIEPGIRRDISYYR